MNEKLAVIKTSVAKRADAESIAAALVEKRAAACVQISQQVLSFYQWKNVLKQEHEFILSIKTTVENCKKVIDLLKQMHPYELPEIILSEIQAEKNYQAWMKSQLQ